MESVTPNFLFHNWQRKLIALAGAIFIWFFVNQTITMQKTLTNVRARVINLPKNKTIDGLLPNGILGRRLALNLTGTKDVMEMLESSDLEVLVDAANQPDEWILQVSKKNLVSLNPEIDLKRHIQSITHNDIVIKMSELVTDQVPVKIRATTDEAPEGYEFLDLGPQELFQTITGKQETIQQLKEKGVILNIDLAGVTKEELDALRSSSQTFRNDEVNFLLPENWKTLNIPLIGEENLTLNDPQAKNLTVTFLRKEVQPLGTEIPIRIFYPIEFSNELNPTTRPLLSNQLISKKNSIHLFRIPLYVREVSRLFLDIVRNNIEIVVVAAPESEREELQWSVEYINQQELENTFVAFLIHAKYSDEKVDLKKREARLRRRFREYASHMDFYLPNGKPLSLECRMTDEGVVVNQPTTLPVNREGNASLSLFNQ